MVMHTMLWPDELRDGGLRRSARRRHRLRRRGHHGSVVHRRVVGRVRAEGVHDSYREALETLVQSKADGIPLEAEQEVQEQAEVVDLVAALRASVEAAKKRRESAAEAKAV